ncbi:zona pellucida sperm-binding protein 3-like [Hyperolius riggenbachi]|uniref:zona pellucida sperm-binding protein 3-like n=1 Tax=Hyperolius riggenbachi TaxID=752182 RepID=UPI0035A2D486
MGLGGSRWCSWLLVLTLVYGLGYGSARDGGLARDRRQQDWWREYQRFSPAQGSARASARDFARPVVGFGSRRGGSPSGWGSSFGGLPRQAVQQVSQSSPISLQCGEDVMVISVSRNFYGNGKLVKPSDLTLGPQSCQPTSQTADTVVFQNALQDCSNPVQMSPDWVIYSTSLSYIPTASRDVPIIRTNSAVVPIQCFYHRHSNVSSDAIKPTWSPFSTTVSSEERMSFSLNLMSDDWNSPRNSITFHLGDVINIEASVETQNHIDLILYVDSCVATLSQDPTSSPNYNIIAANGCLMDGMQDDASSAFRYPRITPDKLQFSVDAFRFLNVDQSMIFITCYLRVVPADKVPDSMNKACSYSKSTSSWTPLEGSNAICQCCSTGTCSSPPPGQSRGWGGRPRQGKRDLSAGAQKESEQMVTTLGPLLIIGPEASRTFMVTEESTPVELWVLVATGGFSLLVVLVCAVVIGKSMRRPQYAVAMEK